MVICIEGFRRNLWKLTESGPSSPLHNYSTKNQSNHLLRHSIYIQARNGKGASRISFAFTRAGKAEMEERTQVKENHRWNPGK